MTARSVAAGAAVRFESGINPPLPEQWPAYLATHGRSFSFASALIPEPYRSRLVAVYAYCRFTDDLVDTGGGPRAEALARLDWWLDASASAYRGIPTEHAMLQVVMQDMAARRVPFEYVSELIAGMRMDLLRRRFDTIGELRTYCYRVASVVGLWLTELFGVHDKATLERAGSLGVAMQLTNIVRDVGEDWRNGRLYLPRDLMRQHGLTTATIDRVQKSRHPVPREYAALLEDLMVIAEREYQTAWQGLSALPEFFRPAVGVASRVYAAIHDVVRASGYDTLRRRAATSSASKLAIAAATLRELGVPAAALDLLRPRA
jgi:15-cis-phytoene synthase